MRRQLQSYHTKRRLILMLLYIFIRLADHTQIQRLGERGIIRSGAAHINHALLKVHDRTGGHNRHSFQCQCLAASYGIHTGDEAREDASPSFDLDSGFHHILHGRDTNRLTRFRHLKIRRLDFFFRECNLS